MPSTLWASTAKAAAAGAVDVIEVALACIAVYWLAGPLSGTGMLGTSAVLYRLGYHRLHRRPAADPFGHRTPTSLRSRSKRWVSTVFHAVLAGCAALGVSLFTPFAVAAAAAVAFTAWPALRPCPTHPRASRNPSPPNAIAVLAAALIALFVVSFALGWMR